MARCRTGTGKWKPAISANQENLLNRLKIQLLEVDVSLEVNFQLDQSSVILLTRFSDVARVVGQPSNQPSRHLHMHMHT